MPWNIYDNFKLNQWIGSPLNFSADTFKCMLVTSGYSPNMQTDEYAGPVQTSYEVPTSGTGYTAGGLLVTGMSAARTPSTDTIVFTCNSIIIAQDASGGFSTAYYAILYKSTGNMATSPLICLATFSANKSNVGGPLEVQIDVAGLFSLT